MLRRCSRWMVTLMALVGTPGVQAAPAELVFALRPLPPYMVSDGGRFRGPYVEIMQELARRLGVPLRIVECPLIRCLRMLEEGSADVSMGLVQTPERAASIHFLEPPYAQSTRTFFYMRRTETRPLNRYEDLRQFRIGVVRGLRHFDAFDTDERLTRDEAPDMRTNFRKLAAGHVDVVPVGAGVGRAMVAQLGLSNVVAPAPYVRVNHTQRQVSLSLRSGWYPEHERITRVFGAMVREGVIRRALARAEGGAP